ncbi:MAG: spore photoproduct lyase family protein [Candidatus Omnitrophota bacterium]
MVRANAAKRFVAKRFTSFGPNKRNELARLFFEIAKREDAPLGSIAREMPQAARKFRAVKSYLIARRYPAASQMKKPVKPYFPELSVDPQYKVRIKKRPVLCPKNIFIEEGASKSSVARCFRNFFPEARVRTIPSLKAHIQEKRHTISDYNARRDNFFIVKQRHDFFKRCPCTKGARSCGYHVFNLGYGCVYECTYCYLQEYTNSPGIIIPSNIDDFFKAFSAYRQDIRLGTGEFTDSLALDHITEFSGQLIEFFKKHPKSTFEFKTKSDNIEKLLAARPGKNIVAAWSLNPQTVIDKNEFYTASLIERLTAAEKCVAAGSSVAFHFDPIIMYEGWEKGYRDVVDLLFDTVSDKDIAWISLGTLRFSRRLKKVIENRFPDNTLLDGELLPGFDGKMRYERCMRGALYRKMLQWIRRRNSKVSTYLCMEDTRKV